MAGGKGQRGETHLPNVAVLPRGNLRRWPPILTPIAVIRLAFFAFDRYEHMSTGSRTPNRFRIP